MIKYLAIYKPDTMINSISFRIDILNHLTFNALLCTIRNEIDIHLTDKQIINDIRLYAINEMPIDYIHAICNMPIDNSNRIDSIEHIQVDGFN